MKTEFVSCFEARTHYVCLKIFIFELRIMDSIFRPLIIYCDNPTIIFMAKNNKSDSPSKHIDIKYLATKKHVKQTKAVIKHISTELIIADPLINGTPLLKFKDHVMKIRLGSIM